MNANRLTTPKGKVQELQEKLGHADKESNKRKSHALCDKVYRWNVLREAWKRVKANKGAARVDAVTLADIGNKEKQVSSRNVSEN
ncbi:TetR family transcriptional regulator [Paenibacillus donghaensis]|uniref:TetR family transcriptional regulator n=1 Tax=Paenibacillus donghaensis TaxID=414771 RepID=UPI001FE7AB55|nr:TetR family transcriptional regulator [Paenibacillus donghaensis]